MEIRTERLVLRMMRESDAPVLTAYRNDPVVARWQDWDLPYTLERSVSRLREQNERTDFEPGEWTTLAVELDGELIGDVVAHVDERGRVAEIGYTFRPEFQGKGYASEAASAMVDHLLERFPIHRIEASLDKDNVASMRVLEGLGMQFETLTRRSYFMRGEYEDDLRYAMLRDDRTAWLNRPSTPPSSLELVELTPDDAHLWGRLRTHHSQERFVSPMANSFRDALFPEVVDGAPVVPWMRGVLADGERAAFVLMADATEHHPEPYLWRLLVDRMHQRRGLGRLIVGALRDLLASQGHRSMLTSYVEGPGTPAPFYARLGFVPTGRIVGDDDGPHEIEARLTW